MVQPLKKICKFLIKLNVCLPYDPSNSMYSYFVYGHKKLFICSLVHSSFIHNSEILETTQMSVNRK